MIKSKKPYVAKNRYSNTDATDATGSSGFNWGIITEWLGIVKDGAVGLFSPKDKYIASANAQLYNQEKRTNTILWVIIGLMVALGVVLLVRKTK